MGKGEHSLMDWEHRIKTLYNSLGTLKLSPLFELMRNSASATKIPSQKLLNKFAEFTFPKYCQGMFFNLLKS